MQAWYEGEVRPRSYTIRDSNGDPVDLTSATVTLLLTADDGTVLTTTGDVVVTTPLLGLVTFTPDSGDLRGQDSPLRVVWSVSISGAVQYFPVDGADEWVVYPPGYAAPRLTFKDLRKQTLRWLDATDELDTGSDLDELVKQALNEANATRATEYGWPFMRNSYQLPVTGDQRRYALPGNLGRLLFIWSPTDLRYLQAVPDRHLDDQGLRHDGIESGSLYQPFELRGHILHFFNSPRNAETLVLSYFKTPTRLQEDQDLPNIPYPHSQLLVWDALLDLKPYANELGSVPLWAAKQTKAEGRLYAAFNDAQILGSVGLSVKPGTGNF